MKLFTKNGSEPVELPFSDIDASGDTWTNLAENSAGRLACGWTAAPDQPVYDPEAASIAWTDSAWVITPFSAETIEAAIDTLLDARLLELADIRWQRQQTVTIDGQIMAADDTTIGRCNAAEAFARLSGLDLDAPRNWKLGLNTWITLTTRQIIAYGLAIGTKMQACFDHEKDLSDLLVAARPNGRAALGAVDLTAGWPE